MFFWKIDEETIRCLIHKQEIHSMGFDLDALTQDHAQMEAFLNAIVQSSRNYIDWHTENGIQNYIAKSLPADQLLVTISCTFPDVAIDRDLEQIKKMTTALNARITDERIEQIYAMTGEEKERAFEEMSKDLHDVCMGNIETEEEESSQSEDPVIVKGEERTDAFSVDIEVARHLYTAEHDYETFHLSMDCFVCSIVAGTIVDTEHEDMKWLPLDSLWSVDWLPADIKVVEAIEASLA